MGDRQVLFDGTVDSTPTAASLGVDTLFFTGGSAKLTADTVEQGATGLLLTLGAGQSGFVRCLADNGGDLLGADRFYATIKTLPTADADAYWLAVVYQDGTNARLLNVRIHQNGTLSILDNGNASLAATTASTPATARVMAAGSTTTNLALTVGSRYRFEAEWQVGTTTTNGYWALRIYPTTGNVDTPLNNTAHANSGSSTANLGTANWYRKAIGITNTFTAAGNAIGVDAWLLRAGSRAPVGKYVVATNQPPSGSFSSAARVLEVGGSAAVAVAATDPEGQALTYALSFVESLPAGATPPTLSATNTATATLNATNATPGSRHLLRARVQDPAGNTLDVTQYVKVLGREVRPIEIIGGTDWEIIGGAASAIAALADTSTTTGVSYPSTATGKRTIILRLAPCYPLDVDPTLTWVRKLSESDPGNTVVVGVAIYQGPTERVRWAPKPTATLATGRLAGTEQNGTALIPSSGSFASITDWTELDVWIEETV